MDVPEGHKTPPGTGTSLIEERFPFSNVPENFVGLYHPDSGYIDVQSTLHALFEVCNRLGVDIYENEEFQSVDSTASDKVSIRSDIRRFSADKLILAPGPFANNVFE